MGVYVTIYVSTTKEVKEGSLEGERVGKKQDKIESIVRIIKEPIDLQFDKMISSN